MNIIKIKYYLVGVVCILSFVIFTSCTAPIGTKYSTSNTVEIRRGDSAKLYWEFYDADRVIVDSTDKVFSIVDSCFVSPRTSSRYKVQAINRLDERLDMDWYVSVIEPTSTELDLKKLDASSYRSPIPEILTNPSVAYISIVGSKIVDTANKKFIVKFLPYDDQGKVINDIHVDNNNLKVLTPFDNSFNPLIHEVRKYFSANNTPINFCICIDNSAASLNNDSVLSYINLTSKQLPLNDNYYLSYFNQNFGGVEPIKRDADGQFDIAFQNIPQPSGFSAINKSVGRSLNYLREKAKTDRNVIIIIANNADNASVLYDENDLIEYCNNYNIPIYVIAVGTDIPTYNLSNLASSTGGKIYYLLKNETNSISTYIQEIVLSQQYYYSVEFAANISDDEKYLDIELELSGTNKDAYFKDNYSFPLKKQKMFADYQIIASYNVGDTVVSSVFEPAISDVAEALLTNSELVLELIGNSSSVEGNEDICNKFALTRAQAIRKKLMENGVKSKQIRVSSESSYRPLFQSPKTNWQFMYNNRVEVRWLSPEEMPYEIIAGYYTSEDEALSEVTKWESKKYLAYYQRIMQNQRPAYRVLLWGYSTEDAASKEAKKLSNEYKRTFVVK